MASEPQVTVSRGPRDGDEITCADALALLCEEDNGGGYEIRALVPEDGGRPVAYELVYYSEEHMREMIEEDLNGPPEAWHR